MHELSVTESIVKICCEEANKNNINTITTINLKVGELSNFVPSCIQYYFDILSNGTIVQGALLNIDRIPIKIYCKNCDEKGNIELEKLFCPKCKCIDIEIIEGNEFFIYSMEGE